MDIRQLTYFIAIAESNTISDAAKKLNIAQSALSQMLKQLETELGTILIERHKKQHHLTPSGCIMYDEALSITAQINQAKQRIQDSNVGILGSINIGVDALLSTILYSTIKDYLKTYPDIKLNIFQNDQATLQEMLEARQIDVALTHYALNEDEFISINKETVPVYLVYSDNYDEHWTMNEILRQSKDIILPLHKDEKLYKELTLWLNNSIGCKKNITSCADVKLLLQLIKTNQCVSFIPEFLLRELPKSIYIHEVTLPTLTYSYQWVYLKNRYFPKILTEFLSFN